MQVPGAHVDQPADVAIGADHAVHLVRLDDLQFMLIAQRQQFITVSAEGLEMAWLVRQVAVAPGEVAFDGELGHALADDFHRFDTHQLEIAHALRADDAGKLIDVVADTANQLAAVAATGTPAYPPRLQQHHREPALGQFDGGIQSGEAAADDAYIGLFLPFQCRQEGLAVARGKVPGIGVIGGMDGMA